MEISDIITQSIRDHEPEGSDTSAEPEVTESADVQAEAAPEAAVEEKPATPDDVVKELETHGYKATAEGQRENRIPYSKVKKIVENAKKKVSEEYRKQIEEHTGKLTVAERQLQDLNKVNELIRTDPDRYLQILSAMHPQYRKFLQQQAAANGQPKPEPVEDKMPPPDAKFEDGSSGYSPEGLIKLFEWRDAKVLAKVREENAKRFGPIEQSFQAHQTMQEQVPVVRAQIDGARKRWGSLFDEHQEEILTVMGQRPPSVSFAEIVQEVLVPKLNDKMAAMQPNRDTMRAEILKELNGRPGSVGRSTPMAAQSKSDDPAGPRSVEDVIREQLAKLR